MNILVASIFNINSYSRGIMPEVLQTQIDKNPGASIYYLTNSNSFDVCYFNIHKKPEICYSCKTGAENTLKLIEGPFKHIKISDIVNKDDYKQAKEFFNKEERISFHQVYDNFEVGEATLSTYISRSRDRDLLYVKQDYLKELAINSLALYLGTIRFLKEKEIDVVYNFNGRQDYVRGIMRAAMAVEVDCYNLERTRVGGFLEAYKNVFTHNIRAKKALVDACWEESKIPEEEKIKIGSKFFHRQKAGESVIFPSYLTRQTKSKLPEEFLNGNENVVLFNSSDDEFAALGDEFQNPLFENQNEGIKYLVGLFGERLQNKNLIIRMHPNLSSVNFEYVKELRDLHQKYPNIFVVQPESEINSYALLDSASKVLTFGSTLGLEANFSGKPVILLGKCFYYYSNVAYTPIRKEEIPDMITQVLLPLPKINALKFGYYYLQGGKKATYYFEKNIRDSVYFKGKLIPSFSLLQRVSLKIIQGTYEVLGIRLKFKKSFL